VSRLASDRHSATSCADSAARRRQAPRLDRLQKPLRAQHVPPAPILPDPRFRNSEELAREWNVKGNFDITIGRFYFRESDWRRIVLEKVEDNLLRAESSTEYFDQWKHMFASYDSHQRHIFGLFDSELSGGYVYLIEASDTGNFKIGFTKNPDIEQRRSQLQTGNSEELVVRGSFRCASPQTEKVLHTIFKESRRQGEWFALSVGQARNILDEQWRRENLIF
jgi:hypothetical protein